MDGASAVQIVTTGGALMVKEICSDRQRWLDKGLETRLSAASTRGVSGQATSLAAEKGFRRSFLARGEYHQSLMPSEDEHDESVDAAIDAANQGSAAPPPVRAEGLPPVAPDVVEQETDGQMDDIVPTRGYRLTPTVGLGGSAGSIQALGTFFDTMPADSGFVFVVVLHLSPEHESTLAELLARRTAMPVVQAEDGMNVEANHVYVIPPGKHLLPVDGHLKLAPLEPAPGKRMAVDVFFRTLADTHGAHAAAVVLSGADGDGAVGLKRIKERGGLTVAQDPDEAEHEGMPRAAVATGMVDWVLKAGAIPPRLCEYFAREKRLHLPSEEPRELPAAAGPPNPDAPEASLREI